MYHRNPIPPKEGDCHRTGFAKTCFQCVTEHKCKLWKRVALVLDRHPETGEPIPSDAYDCLDSIQELFWKDMLRRQLQTTATVDKVAATVKDGNDAELVKAVADSREIMEMRRHVVAGVEAMREASAQLQSMTLAVLSAPDGSAPLMIEQN